MKIVLDTNILVAAFRSRLGASYAIVSRIPSDDFQLSLSVPLYVEYQDVLLREGKVPGFTESEILGFLRYLCQESHHQEIFYLWRPVLKDAKDDLVLELAVASESKIIVTHNVRDFRGSEKFGIEALSPQQFLKILEEK
ncbi:MAG: putative toxin-antitoxin system toxin component, PIN family [Allomuricauda sp.]